MKTRLHNGLGLAAMAAVASLVGCNPSQLPLSAPGAVPPASKAVPARQALLYVAHNAGYKTHEKTGLTILTYPQGIVTASIPVKGYIGGLCTDNEGNVWMPYNFNYRAYVAEFRHGGTKPILQLRLPKDSFAYGCAIDPTSGDLAVMSDTSTYSGSVTIWKAAQKGSRTLYRTPFVPEYGAYDDAGNLYIDGFPGGSDFWLEFGELPKGSPKVVRVALDRVGDAVGGVQWDGKYVVIATDVVADYGRRIFDVVVSGSNGHVAAAWHMNDMSQTSPIYVDGSAVIGVTSYTGSRQHVATWLYPGGGQPSKYKHDFHHVAGVTVSK